MEMPLLQANLQKRGNKDRIHKMRCFQDDLHARKSVMQLENIIQGAY